MDNVNDFLSPNFHHPMPFKYLLLLFVTILAISKRPLEFTEIVLVLLFTNMALFSARYIPLFAIVVAPIISRQADSMITIAPENGWISFVKKRGGGMAKIDPPREG